MSQDRPAYDPLGLTAAIDQTIAAMAEIAGAVSAYRKALIEQGIPLPEAVVLVRDWHWIMLTNGKTDRGKQP